MIQKKFKYNPNAGYPHSSAFKNKSPDIINQTIIVTSDTKGFKISFQDLFEKYVLPKVNTSSIVNLWQTDWMNFWQNQLNFAIWCATTGCGVDYENHLQADGMIGSLFRFHVYYQTRRILFEMSAALPQDKSWSPFQNSYDRSAYERICREFNVDKNADWRIKGPTQGLGKAYEPWPNTAGYRMANWPSGNLPPNYVFATYSGKGHWAIKFVEQDATVSKSWSTLILDSSDGFTKAGVERINDSIRTYCWAILGAQSQTRTDILGTGTAFDAQKQFLADIEDAINSPVDLPSQISRYENVLKYARSKVDFVFGIGLYMAPSDMELQISTNIQGYNNEIVIATDQQSLGLNNNVNAAPVPPKVNHTVSGTPTKQILSGWGLLGPLGPAPIVLKPSAPKPLAPKSTTPTSTTPTETELTHDETKSALILGSILVGLGAIAIYKFT